MINLPIFVWKDLESLVGGGACLKDWNENEHWEKIWDDGWRLGRLIE